MKPVTSVIRKDLSENSLAEAARQAAIWTGVPVPSGAPWKDDPLWCAYVLKVAADKASNEENSARAQVTEAQLLTGVLREAHAKAAEALRTSLVGA